MLKNLKDILSGLFILLVAFTDAIYFMVLGALNMGRNQTLFRVYHFVVAALAVIYFLSKIRRIPKNAKLGSFVMIVIVTLFFYLTRFFYGYAHPYYSIIFVSLFARFVPSLLVGVAMVGDRRSMIKIEKSLPIFLAFFTVILVSYIFSAQIDVNIGATFSNEAGLSYQSLSYYSIYMYGFAIYLVSFGKIKKFWKVIFLGVGLVCIVLCIMTGGRGAFVLGVILTLYFFWKRHSFSSILIAVVFFVVLYWILGRLQNNAIFEMGSNRLLDFFGNSDAVESDIRWKRWGIAWRAFLASPVFGHGLGSVFYEVGMYSHNVFTDILCEGGILLLGLFVANLTKFFVLIHNITKTDDRIKIIFIVFLCAFVLLCFSGYYLSTEAIWLALGYVLPQKVSRRRRNYYHLIRKSNKRLC